jgi:hypothetical protein
MAERVRLNKVIELLQQGQPVFSCGTVMSGNYDELQALSRSDYDLVIVETEHQGFDFPTLRHSLQYLIRPTRSGAIRSRIKAMNTATTSASTTTI